MTERDIPKWCRFRNRRCRVLEYIGNGVFIILDSSDERRIVHRDRLTFTKG